MKAFIAEFIGTFTLIIVGVFAIFNLQNVADGGGLVGIALAHGLAIAVMVSATAAVSGGHLNPAVTMGLLVAGKIDFGNALGYIISQCLGALAAAALAIAVLPDLAGVGIPAPADGISATQVVILEAIVTFFLIFVIYGTAVDRRAPKVGGLFIGLTVTMGILLAGPFTGAAINPARHFGPAMMAMINGDGAHIANWMYWAGPAIGGILAGLVWAAILEDRDDRIVS